MTWTEGKSLKTDHIPSIYAPKISRMQLNKMFLLGPKWFLFFFSTAALLPRFMCQVQRFLAVRHQTNPCIILPALPECAPALDTAQFPLPASQSGWWAWPRKALSPFPGQLQSPSWARFGVVSGNRRTEGRNRTHFFHSKTETELLLAADLSPHLAAHVNLSASERTGMKVSLASCQSPSSGLSSPGHREWGGIVWGTSTAGSFG